MADDPNIRPTKRHHPSNSTEHTPDGDGASAVSAPDPGSALAFEGMGIVVQHLRSEVLHLREELRSTVRESDAPGYMVELKGIKGPAYFDSFANVHAFLKDARIYIDQIVITEFPWKRENILAEFDTSFNKLEENHVAWQLSIDFGDVKPVCLLSYTKFVPRRNYEGSVFWERIKPVGPISPPFILATVQKLKELEDDHREDAKVDAQIDAEIEGESKSGLSLSGGDVGDDVADVGQGPELSDHGDGEGHRREEGQDCHEQ